MSKTWECGKCGRNNAPHRRKCQTWNCRERGPGQEDGGSWDCGCGCESNFASRSRCRSCGAVRGRYQPQFTQSTFAAVVVEEAAKLHAQLGQDAIDVPMMETGPDEAPSEEAEREQLRTLLANLDASIAALTPVAAGDEDVCQILQAEQEKRKRIQAQLSALRPLKTRLRASHETHEEANKKNKALVEEEESVMALLLAKQSLTQQAKEARDVKAKELEEVEVEARTAREGSAQSRRNSSTRSSSPMSPSQ